MESVREKRLSAGGSRWSIAPPEPDYLAQAVDCRASLATVCSRLAFTTGGDNGGWIVEAGSYCHHDDDQVVGTTCDDGADWLQTTVSGAGTLNYVYDAAGRRIEKQYDERTGQPLGEPAVLDRVERVLGRRVRPATRGPKPKSKRN